MKNDLGFLRKSRLVSAIVGVVTCIICAMLLSVGVRLLFRELSDGSNNLVSNIVGVSIWAVSIGLSVWDMNRRNRRTPPN